MIGFLPLPRIGGAYGTTRKKRLGHDVRALDECLDEIDVFLDLDFHELGRLVLVLLFEEGDIGP